MAAKHTTKEENSSKKAHTTHKNVEKAGQDHPEERAKHISKSVDINYPLTNPAKKAQKDRIAREEAGTHAKPAPVFSEDLDVDNDPVSTTPTESPEEYEKKGGMKVTDTAKDVEKKAEK